MLQSLKYLKLFFVFVFMSVFIFPQTQKQNDRIIFISTRDGNNQIYIMDSNGWNTKRISTSSDAKYWPRVSPNGQKIIYTNNDAQLCICDINGSNQLVLSNPNEKCYTPSWSPDGKRIIFSSTRGGYKDDSGEPVNNIWIMDVDGTDADQLTFTNYDNSVPCFSPDGTKIVFTSLRDNVLFSVIDKSYSTRQKQIYIMNVDGSNQTRLTVLNSGISYNNPIFSPDGNKIVYLTQATSIENSKWAHVFIMNSNGSHPMRLSEMNAVHGHPYWSTNGQRIIFYAELNGIDQIMQMNYDGSNIVQLTNSSANNFTPSCFK